MIRKREMENISENFLTEGRGNFLEKKRGAHLPLCTKLFCFLFVMRHNRTVQQSGCSVFCSTLQRSGSAYGAMGKIQKTYIEGIELHGKIYSYVQLVDKSLDATQQNFSPANPTCTKMTNVLVTTILKP